MVKVIELTEKQRKSINRAQRQLAAATGSVKSDAHAVVEELEKEVALLSEQVAGLLMKLFLSGENKARAARRLSRVVRFIAGLPRQRIDLNGEPTAAPDETGKFVVCNWPRSDELMRRVVDEARREDIDPQDCYLLFHRVGFHKKSPSKNSGGVFYGASGGLFSAEAVFTAT